ncbi:MAG: helix-turn-helix transcriptional regulator [Bacteroidota bacterium]
MSIATTSRTGISFVAEEKCIPADPTSHFMDLLQAFKDHKSNLSEFARSLPCILHINDSETFALKYLDPGFSARVVIPQGMSREEAFEKLPFVNPDDLQEAIASLTHYLAHRDEYSTASFLQRVHTQDKGWITLYTTSIVNEDLGGLVSFSVELDAVLINDRQVEALIAETDFIKHHFQQFSALTDKERQFIKLWVQNMSTAELAERMGITSSTAKTYKKRIYAKLDINSYAELWEYAVAFDLNS